MTMHTAERTLPRGALFAAAAMVVLALAAAAMGRIGGPVELVEPSAVVQSRSLLFQDRDGAILVTDARTGAVVEEFPVGAGGFIRGSMRGLARERKRWGAGAETPFLLERLADGRLTLTDPVTARTIDLAAFGSTNSAVFAHLLPEGGALEGATR